MKTLINTKNSAIETMRYIRDKGANDVRCFTQYILKPCLPHLMEVWRGLDVIANDIVAPSLMATIDEVVRDCEGREAAQAFYAVVDEVVGETPPTCIQCDKPAEWAEAYCQEHWEQHCSEAWFEAVEPACEVERVLQQIDDTPIPASASCGWGRLAVSDSEAFAVELLRQRAEGRA